MELVLELLIELDYRYWYRRMVVFVMLNHIVSELAAFGVWWQGRS